MTGVQTCALPICALDGIFREQPDFVKLLGTPTVTMDEKLGMIKDIIADGVSEYTGNLLCVLTERGRMGCFSGIVKNFRALYNEHFRIAEITVTASAPLSLELLTINALVAADSVLIPVQCEYYALEGIADLMRSIKMCNKRLNPELTVQGIVMTMYDGRTKLSDQVVNEVRKFFGKKVYKTMIPRNVRLSEAPSHRKPAIAYDKESKGARAYLHLAGELIKREEKAAKAAEAAAAAAAAEVEYG